MMAIVCMLPREIWAKRKERQVASLTRAPSDFEVFGIFQVFDTFPRVRTMNIYDTDESLY